MINLRLVHSSDAVHYLFVESLLQASFPPAEYRPMIDWRQLTDSDNAFYNNAIEIDGHLVGLITYWLFPSFCFVEHFAIHERYRGQHYGAQALAHLRRQMKRPLVLEVELPETPLAVRRIDFYRRQGFELWEIPYQQPPYRPGDPYLPMHLMVCGTLPEGTDFNSIRRQIYGEVYGVYVCPPAIHG